MNNCIMTTGSLSGWNTLEHHGIIVSDDDGSEVFVHAYDLNRSDVEEASLSLGMRLAFTAVNCGGHLPRATAIKSVHPAGRS
jgi:cold shock CspA family protein